MFLRIYYFNFPIHILNNIPASLTLPISDFQRENGLTTFSFPTALAIQAKHTVVQRGDKEPGHEFELAKDVPVYESLGFNAQEDTLYMDYYITGDEEGVTCEDVDLYRYRGGQR